MPPPMDELTAYKLATCPTTKTAAAESMGAPSPPPLRPLGRTSREDFVIRTPPHKALAIRLPI